MVIPTFAQQQPAPAALTLDWRSVGNSALESAVPVGLSSGAVARVWFSADGAKLYARLETGQTVETTDFETWTPATAAPAPTETALGKFNWAALTEYRGYSILGAPPADAAISPVDKEDLVVANAHGVWRSLDGGESWVSLNTGLPNFPGRRFTGTPGTTAGVSVQFADGIREGQWQPGEKRAWKVVYSQAGFAQNQQANMLQGVLGARPERIVIESGAIFAGVQGALAVSTDTGQTWRRTDFAAGSGATISSIYVFPGQAQLALASISSPSGTRVLRTMNGGIFWDDMTADLPVGAVNGVTADLESGTIYAATSAGLYMMVTDLRSAGAPGTWTKINTNSTAAVLDVTLGVDGHQLWTLLDHVGVRRALAPHRLRVPKVVNGADGSTRQTAPGGLLSVYGAKVARASTGTQQVPVLAASDRESQLQVPFTATGSIVTLALEGSATGTFAVGLRSASPAILMDGDGAAILLDADRGAMIDTTTPARPGTTLQILATGLGKVTPDWPAGTPAPAEGTPKVVAPIRAWLDRVPVEIKQATLAPGYAGLYLVEIEVPLLVNTGPNELYLEMDQVTSNRVTLHVSR